MTKVLYVEDNDDNIYMLKMPWPKRSTTCFARLIAFTSRSVAALRENDLANRRPPMPPFTRGGTTAAVCSKCRLQRNLRIRLVASRQPAR
jgi:hypothetical protein